MIVPPRRRENFRDLYNILPRTTEKKLATKEEKKMVVMKGGFSIDFIYPLKSPRPLIKIPFIRKGRVCVR